MSVTAPLSTPAAAPAAAARPRRRRRPLIVAAVLILATLTVTSLPGVRRGIADPGGRAAVTGVTRVEAGTDFWEYFAFSPSAVAVPTGAELTWAFTGGPEHNVVLDDLASPTQEDGTWSRTFDRPGSYRYTCTLHQGMDGRVDVVAAP